MMTAMQMAQSILNWEHVCQDRELAINHAKKLFNETGSAYFQQVLGILKSDGKNRSRRRHRKSQVAE